MRYLSLGEVLELHRLVVAQSGGGSGVRELGGVQAAVAQPKAAFGGAALYPEVADKAAALGFSLVLNHPFVDGNKRIGHAAMEVCLLLNGYEISAPVDEQEQLILQLADGQLSREQFTDWVKSHITKK